jgi:hypothetical protein
MVRHSGGNEHLNDDQLLDLEEWMLDYEYQQLEEVIDEYL